MAQQIPSSGGWLPASARAYLGNWASSQTPPNDNSSSIESAAQHPPLTPPPPVDSSSKPKSFFVVGDTLYDDDDFSPEDPPSLTAASALEQEAELSGIETVYDKASKLFSWTTGLPGRGISWTLNKGRDIALDKLAQGVAKKSLTLIGTSPPDTPLRKLRNCLLEIRQEMADQIEISHELRSSTANAIAHFLANPKACLADCYAPGSLVYPESLTLEQEKQFQVLLKALQDKTALSDQASFLRFIQPLCEFTDKCCVYQLDAHRAKIGKELVGKATAFMPSSAAPMPPKQAVRAKSRLKPPSLPKPPIENPVPLIIKEIEELKSLGFRIALALLVLPESSIHKKAEEESGGLAGLIRKSTVTLGDPNDIFQNLIYTEIDNSDLTYLQKQWKKTSCWMMAPAIAFIVDHVLDESRDIALYLIGVTPEERLKMVVKMFIEPGRDFISWLQSKYKGISLVPELGMTVDEAVSNAIDQIKIKDRHGKDLTSTELINRLIGSLMDKYAPALNWASAATAHFEKRAEQSSPFLALWFISWSYLTWAVNIISAPGRWLMDKIIRKVLKTVVVSKIQSKINENSDSSLHLGQLALHSIYKTLFQRLQEKNRGKRESESEGTRKNLALEQRGFVDKEVQDSISQLVSSFLKLLYIQGSDVIDLPSNLSTNKAMEWAFAPGIQKTTEEIIHGLQISLDNSTFSAGILDVIKDLHQQSLRFNTGNTDINLARLENDFYVELKDAVKHGIQEVIDDKLDPSNRIQKEADLFIDGLKYDTTTFRNEFVVIIKKLTPSSMKKLKQSRDKFLIDAFRRRCETANAGTNPSTRQHIRSTGEYFERLSKPICDRIDHLTHLVEKQKQLEEAIEDLEQLIHTLNTALAPEPLADATTFYQGLQNTLQRIKNKTYPKPVQDLISTLHTHFDSWRTEAAKKANQTLFNGTIETLINTVEATIDEKRWEIGRIEGTLPPPEPLEPGQQIPPTIAKESTTLMQEITALADWANKLNYFVCMAENQQMDALKQLLSRFAEEGLSPLILMKIDHFFRFLGKNHNVKGMLSFIIKAYLELPQKNPKEFKKIIDKAKSKAVIPIPSSQASSNNRPSH